MAKGGKIHWPNDEPIDQGAHKRAGQDALDDPIVARKPPKVYKSDMVSMIVKSDEVKLRQIPSAHCCQLYRRIEARPERNKQNCGNGRKQVHSHKLVRPHHTSGQLNDTIIWINH